MGRCIVLDVEESESGKSDRGFIVGKVKVKVNGPAWFLSNKEKETK